MEATARVDRSTKALVQRIHAGEIAVISHPDIDAVSANALVAAKVAAVINAAASSTERYPNAGPRILLDAGIPVLDGVGSDVLDLVGDGDVVGLHDSALVRGGNPIASGRLLSKESVLASEHRGRENLRRELGRFAANTLERIIAEADSLVSAVQVPDLVTPIEGRHVVVVTRGNGYREDLATMRAYIADVKPVLVGVDGGADALLEIGCVPDIVIGDMDSASDAALRAARERVVHAYMDGRAPGLARLEVLGLGAHVLPAKGTSEDVALTLAYDMGADIIVAVGTHTSLVEFLDKGRPGMASTFLCRLKVGDRLVDAKGVSKLYRASIRPRHLAVLLFAGCITAGTIISLSPWVQRLIRLLGIKLDLLLQRLAHAFGL
jgi:uncharacterized membrane-anchored protein